MPATRMKFPARERLNSCRRQMEKKSAYLASAVIDLGQAEFSADMDTACIIVNGADIHLLFNREFFEKLKEPELTAVLAHEAYHFIFKHMPRSLDIVDQEDKYLFTLACEAVINDIIIEYFPDFHLPGTPITGPVLLGQKTFTMSAEAVLQQLKQKVMSVPGFLFGLAKWATTDNHEFPGQDPNDLPPRLRTLLADGWNSESDNVLNKTINSMGRFDKVDIGTKALGASRGTAGGKVITDLKRFLADAVSPSQRCTADWHRLNPKLAAIYPSVILPRLEAASCHSILMAIDASGSISDYFISAALATARLRIPDVNIEIISFDTKAYPVTGSDKVRGGGGTCVQCVQDYAVQMKRRPDIIFVFTDGHFKKPSLRHPENWVWILPENGTAACIPKGGKVVRIAKRGRA